MKIKYVAYIRKSSESKEKQALSIRSQRDKLREEFPDLEIVEWIEEEKSAFKPYNRPKFTKMMEKIHSGEITGIIAWHPDRLSRNEIDAGNITYALRCGILKDLKFASYNFTISPEGIQQLQNSLSASQYSSAKLGVDVKRGLGDKLNMGRMPSQAPIGYLNTKLATRGENKIIEDPERFNLVRQMWDLMLTGSYSVPQVRDIANNKWGLRSLKKKRVGGSPIGYTSAYSMFSNIFYTGNFIYRGILHKGDHKAMITMEEFDLVQKILKEDGKPRAKTYEFAYGSGTFRCEECNHSFVGIEKIKYIKSKKITKGYTLYLCGGKKRVTSCSQRYNMNEIDLEEQIKNEISKYTIDEEFLHWALEVMKDNNFVEVATAESIKDSVKKTLEDKQEELKKLIQMAMKGFISDEEFKESRAELDKTINNLKSQFNENEIDKDKNLMELTEKAFNFSAYALIAMEKCDKHTKKEIIKSLGLNRTIKDKKLNIIANEWYTEIRKGYFSLRKILNENEPEISCRQRTIDDFPHLRSLLRDLVDEVGTAIREHNGYIYIPDLIKR